MSYDVYLQADVGSPDGPLTIIDVGNYTSNVAKMFEDALALEIEATSDHGAFVEANAYALKRLEGHLGEDCVAPLRGAIARMEDEPVRYRAMEPSNGWGNYEGALDYLRKILAACIRAPRARIYVSA